jgi:hypothetical protein
MTVAEAKNEFGLQFDNLLDGNAPGLDNYEISVYLTTGQEELVKAIYTGKNSDGTSYEQTEHSKRALNELTVNYNVTDTITSTRGLFSDSKFYELPIDLMFIASEKGVISSTDSCLNGKDVDIIPSTHDEISEEVLSPFRKPSHRRALRLDISKEGNVPVVEIVSKYSLSKYQIRYIKYPNPIIISDLTSDSEVGGMGLTINGKTGVAGFELNSYLSREIINRAVELAGRDYYAGNLKARIEMNSRV